MQPQKSTLRRIEIDRTLARTGSRAVSPFRYPGGKGFLSGFLSAALEKLNMPKSACFCEPYCGGAGAALNLLADGKVARLLLNDADIRIYSAWKAMLSEPRRFIDEVLNTPLTVEQWEEQRETLTGKPCKEYSFKTGFAAFYLNRTSRSGMIVGSGPIGGYTQKGRWLIDARFNRKRLAQQIEVLSKFSNNIRVSNLDGLSFLEHVRRSEDVRECFFLIDPPYVKEGNRLYWNGMTKAKHIALSDFLHSGRLPYWTLTYDNDELVHDLYHSMDIYTMDVIYSLQKKRRATEVLITHY